MCRDDAGLWLATTYDAALAVFRAPDLGQGRGERSRLRSDPRHDRSPALQTLGRMLPFIDPPDHTRLRALIGRAFTPRAVERLRGFVTDLVDGLIDGLVAAAGPDGTVDVMGDFADHIPVAVICELLGRPARPPRRTRRVGRRARARRAPDGRRRRAGRAPTTAPGRFRAVRGGADRRAARPSAGRPPHRAGPGRGGGRRSRRPGARVDRRGVHRGRHREHQAPHRVRDRPPPARTPSSSPGPARARSRGRPPSRRSCGSNHPSSSRSPAWPCATSSSPGWPSPRATACSALVAAANRDPAAYERPDDLDVGRTGPPNLSLASGAHYCTGAGLARLEASVAVERFLTRLPAAAVAGPPEVRDDIRPSLRGYARLPVAIGSPA